jgi:catechol 2,3-dioxygenase-like lactoylglutathione lyase family enzyme
LGRIGLEQQNQRDGFGKDTTMIGYTMLGTNDLTRARVFYDAVMPHMGAKVVTAYTNEKRVWYATGGGSPLLAVTQPHDGANATIGNGSMVALAAESRDMVNAVYNAAISQGGADEGAPGVRGDDPNGFYGAYFRDMDGNKFCVYKVGPA